METNYSAFKIYFTFNKIQNLFFTSHCKCTMNYHVGPDILSTTNLNKFEKSSECIFSLS